MIKITKNFFYSIIILGLFFVSSCTNQDAVGVNLNDDYNLKGSSYSTERGGSQYVRCSMVCDTPEGDVFVSSASCRDTEGGAKCTCGECPSPDCKCESASLPLE